MRFNTLFLLLLIPIIHFGQSWDFEQKMVASDRDVRAKYGYNVVIQNNQILSGAYHEDFDENGQNFDEDAGAIYYLKKNSNGIWSQRQKILAINREIASIEFGKVFDMNQTDLIVNRISGAYTYNYNSVTDLWEDGSRLNFNFNNSSNFSVGSISVDGDTFILGFHRAHMSSSIYNGTGVVVIYDRNSTGQWIESQIIEPSIAGAFDEFGLSSDIDGDYMVVGAPSSSLDNQGNRSPVVGHGAVFVYERDSMGIWNEVQRLTAPVQSSIAQFGQKVKLDGSTLVIGTNSENAVYIYKRDSSGQFYMAQRIQGPSGSEDFSRSLDLQGQFLIVGAGGTDNNAGAAYVYEFVNGTWTQRERLQAPVRSPWDGFALSFNSISIDNENTVIGAYFEDHDENENNFIQSSGSIYTFTFNGTLSEETESLDQIEIYPNPVTDYLNFNNISSTSSQLEVDIYNYLGQQVHREILNNNQRVNMTQLPAGMYIIEVTDINQKQAFKVIKS